MKSEMAIVKEFGDRLPVDVPSLIRALGISYNEVPMPAENSGKIERDGSGYAITVNALEGPQRKRFTAAHELAHYLLHLDLLPSGGHLDRLYNSLGYTETGNGIRPQHEVQANQFAANLLMPALFLRKKYDPDADNVSELARTCAVSPMAMRIRLKSLGLRSTQDP